MKKLLVLLAVALILCALGTSVRMTVGPVTLQIGKAWPDSRKLDARIQEALDAELAARADTSLPLPGEVGSTDDPGPTPPMPRLPGTVTGAPVIMPFYGTPYPQPTPAPLGTML